MKNPDLNIQMIDFDEFAKKNKPKVKAKKPT